MGEVGEVGNSRTHIATDFPGEVNDEVNDDFAIATDSCGEVVNDDFAIATDFCGEVM